MGKAIGQQFASKQFASKQFASKQFASKQFASKRGNPERAGSERNGSQGLRSSVAGLAALLASVSGCSGELGDAGAAGAEGPAELAQVAQPIIGGALDESTSGVVGLALDLGGRVAGHCSGTLIAPNLVLTARHCVALTENSDAEGVVECDTAEFRNTFPARMLLASPKPVRPTSSDDPSYVRGREIRTLGDDKVCGYDIALIILDENVQTGAVPIAPRLQVAPTDREPFSTVGYGLTSVSDPSSDGTRQRADGSLVRCSGEECVSLSNGSIRDSEWASVDAPICSGDSGGPALDEQGRVFGVASRGDPNCEIAVYGDVANWAPFIVDTALTAAELGNYAPPDWAHEEPIISEGLDGISGDRGGCSISGAAPAGSAAERSGRSSLLLGVVLCAGWILRRARRSKLGSPPEAAAPR